MANTNLIKYDVFTYFWLRNLKIRSFSEIFVYLSGAVVKGHPTATGSEVALHPGEPCQESKSEEP